MQVTDYGYVKKVFTNLRRKLKRTEDEEMFDLKTNVLIWGLLMSATLKSAIHLGLEHDQNLVACQNTNFEGIKTLFDITWRLIAEKSFEILNLSAMMYDASPWMRLTLCHDQVIRWAKWVKNNSSFRSKQNCLELMENHLSSVGNLHRIHID